MCMEIYLSQISPSCPTDWSLTWGEISWTVLELLKLAKMGCHLRYSASMINMRCSQTACWWWAWFRSIVVVSNNYDVATPWCQIVEDVSPEFIHKQAINFNMGEWISQLIYVSIIRKHQRAQESRVTSNPSTSERQQIGLEFRKMYICSRRSSVQMGTDDACLVHTALELIACWITQILGGRSWTAFDQASAQIVAHQLVPSASCPQSLTKTKIWIAQSFSKNDFASWRVDH